MQPMGDRRVCRSEALGWAVWVSIKWILVRGQHLSLYWKQGGESCSISQEKGPS